MTDGASTLYKARADALGHHLIPDRPSVVFSGFWREANMSHAWGYGPNNGKNICVAVLMVAVWQFNKLLCSFDIKIQNCED